MSEFEHGPFEYRPAPAGRWSVFYDGERLGTRKPEGGTRADIVEALADDVAAFSRDLQPGVNSAALPAFEIAELVRSTDVVGAMGERLGSMPLVAEVPSLTSGLIDDRFETWLVAGGRARPMSVDEFNLLKPAHIAAAAAITKSAEADLRAAPRAPALAWVCKLLPDSVLTTDADAWRAPSAWEIRHVVGEASFSGVSGSNAASLVGVTPQNFRKYTARDGASGQQRMSFAMWHLLLHRLDVQLLGS